MRRKMSRSIRPLPSRSLRHHEREGSEFVTLYAAAAA
jgi:hypothetical protein